MGWRRRLLAIAVLGILLVSAVPVAAEPWPVSSLPIFARAAPGVTKIGPFTSEPTKQVGLREYVTWRFATDPLLAWGDLTIELADKGANGAWGPFHKVTTVIIDDTGVAYYAMTSSIPRWVSIRGLVPGARSLTTADSRSEGVQARWMAAPPRPVPLTGGTAISPSTTFTAAVKVAALGQTVTWRWMGPPTTLAHQWAAVWIAERAPSGLWGPFSEGGGPGLIQFDAHGVATYQAHSATPAWISVRIYLPAGSPPVPETWSDALQARWR